MNNLTDTSHIYTQPDREAIVRKVALIFAVSTFLTAFLSAYFFNNLRKNLNYSKFTISIEKFSSQEEFNNYFLNAKVINKFLVAPEAAIFPSDDLETQKIEVSQTNVQVIGVDEPDLVKTDGENIYFSREPSVVPLRSLSTTDIIEGAKNTIYPKPQEGRTNVIRATPVDKIKNLAIIAQEGNLLLEGNTLVILNDQKILGYDVSSPEDPLKTWDINLNPGTLSAARLYKGKIYLVTRNLIAPTSPCLLPLLYRNSQEVSLSCTDIYHPNIVVPSNAIFNAIRLDPKTGEVEDKISFTGNYGESVVYVSENYIYSTYTYQKDFAQVYYNFFSQDGVELVPPEVVAKIKKLSSYDISDQSKLTETQIILENYKEGLDSDQRLKFENDLTNRLSQYFEKHKREIEFTGITKIDISGEFKIDSNAEVPGHPLNQFSLDGYQNNLRILTTVGSAMLAAASKPTNDIYILDEKLKRIGSLTGLAEDERIYSVRFVKDKAYLVTFKETDPFFVLDLSNPTRPQLKGQLKLPGYSSYLHPIDEEKILGIGKENQYVKLSLFNISEPENPKELSKYLLSEYWSEVLNSHHAFLLDSRNEIFFIPAGQGGYVFSYKEGSLEIKRVVANIDAKRAVIINNLLYILGNDKMIVLDEKNWEMVVDQLDL